MAGQFNSEDGRYCALISTEGTLKVWDTSTSSIYQEFTPDFQLTSPCTCLYFLSTDFKKSPSKKKHRNSGGPSIPTLYIILGTSSGLLLVYSTSKAAVEFSLNSGTNQSVNCISLSGDEDVYTGVEQNIVVWSLSRRSVISKWQADSEKVTATLSISRNRLLTASRRIKLWDVTSKNVIKTFIGHSSEVILLKNINSRTKSSDSYFLSGSKTDRVLSCWNVNDEVDDRQVVVNFLLEDDIRNVAVLVDESGSSIIASLVANGTVHIFKQTLNGSSKPINPDKTIQVVSLPLGNNSNVNTIPIITVNFPNDAELCIGYGSELVQFERINFQEYTHPIIRRHPQTLAVSNLKELTGTKPSDADKTTQYFNNGTSQATVKRNHGGEPLVAMEGRIENLTLNSTRSSSEVPRTDNLAQLLMQGLHSNDKHILRTVLLRTNQDVIKNTVSRLPLTITVPLLVELSNLIQGKTLSCRTALLWMKNLIKVHSNLVSSCPEVPKLFRLTIQQIEKKLLLQKSLNQLRGRLNLTVTRMYECYHDEAFNSDPLLIFTDKATSEAESKPEIEVPVTDDISDSGSDWNNENEDTEILSDADGMDYV